jgi:hypothetical protein
MKKFAGTVLICVTLAAAADTAHAASVTVGSSRDNTLYAESDTLSNGAGQRVFAGRAGSGGVRRGLMHFDLSGAVPVGATIDSVVLRLNLAQTQPSTQTVTLHRVLADWGEGTSSGGSGEGGGAPAAAGDATWGQRFFGMAQPWTTPGGDFTAPASAGRAVGGALGFYAWRSAGMASDVAFWVQNPSSNFGWELKGNEVTPGTAKAFSSRQATAAMDRPLLTVYYTEVPTGAGALPLHARLFPARPNPFNPATTIRYQVGTATPVHLAVYDARGRLVRTLAEGPAPAGMHDVDWRGDDARGTRVASGVYMVSLRVPGSPAQVQKIVLVK